MVEGPVDLAKVKGLEDAPFNFDVVLKQVCLSNQLFSHLSDVMSEFFLDVLYGTDSSFPSVSHIS